MFVQWAVCLLFLEVVKVLHNYDVLGEARILGVRPIFCMQLRCWWGVTYKVNGFGGIKGWEFALLFWVRICLCGSLNIKHKHHDSNDMLRNVLWAVLRLSHSMPFMCCLSNEDFAWVLMCFITIHYVTILNCCMAMRDFWCYGVLKGIDAYQAALHCPRLYESISAYFNALSLWCFKVVQLYLFPIF